MEKRKLLSENTQLYKEIASDLAQFRPVLAELKRTYEALEIGAFNQEKFKVLVLTGPKNTISFYVDSLEKQLDKLKITSSIMRKNAIASHSEITEALSNAVAKAKAFKPTIYSSRPTLSIKFISFEDGRFVISNEDSEAILETFCRTYIEVEELPILEIAEELQTTYNKFLTVVDDQKIATALGSRLNCLSLIFNTDKNGKASIDAGKLKGLITYKKRRIDNEVTPKR